MLLTFPQSRNTFPAERFSLRKTKKRTHATRESSTGRNTIIAQAPATSGIMLSPVVALLSWRPDVGVGLAAHAARCSRQFGIFGTGTPRSLRRDRPNKTGDHPARQNRTDRGSERLSRSSNFCAFFFAI